MHYFDVAGFIHWSQYEPSPIIGTSTGHKRLGRSVGKITLDIMDNSLPFVDAFTIVELLPSLSRQRSQLALLLKEQMRMTFRF